MVCIDSAIVVCIHSAILQLLLTGRVIETYANESSHICPFLAVRAQFDSDHHQNRRLSSHSYSHESVICLYFLDTYLLSYGEFAFFSLNACGYATTAVENNTAGQSIILR